MEVVRHDGEVGDLHPMGIRLLIHPVKGGNHLACNRISVEAAGGLMGEN